MAMLEEEEEEGGTSTRIDITHKPWTPFHFYPGCVSVPSSYFFVVTWANSHPFVVPCIQYGGEGGNNIISKNGFDTPRRVGENCARIQKADGERKRESHSIPLNSANKINV
jgi:hypothetical protein